MSLKDDLRVLVVDDTSTSRALIMKSLSEIGIKNIVDEDDGRKALHYIAANPVHIILSDYHMPRMDGLELLEKLRKCPKRGKTGFLLITGDESKAVVKEAQELGANNVITKPFTTATIRDALERVVGKIS